MGKKSLKERRPDDPKSTRAFARYLRIAPRKLRRVVGAVRKKPALQALDILATLPQKGARIAAKVLKSAVANAKGIGLDETRLVISDFRADASFTLKRFMPRSMGRADRLLKRTSHLSVTLTEGNKSFRKPTTKLEAADEVVESAEAAPKKRKKKAAAKA